MNNQEDELFPTFDKSKCTEMDFVIVHIWLCGQKQFVCNLEVYVCLQSHTDPNSLAHHVCTMYIHTAKDEC